MKAELKMFIFIKILHDFELKHVSGVSWHLANRKSCRHEGNAQEIILAISAQKTGILGFSPTKALNPSNSSENCNKIVYD